MAIRMDGQMMSNAIVADWLLAAEATNNIIIPHVAILFIGCVNNVYEMKTNSRVWHLTSLILQLATQEILKPVI